MSLVLKNLPILVVLTPLMFSLIAAILPKPRHAWIIVNIASFLTVIFSILLGIEVFENNIINYYLGNWPPPLGIEYVIDKVSIIPIFIIAVISLLASLFAHNFFITEINPSGKKLPPIISFTIASAR